MYIKSLKISHALLITLSVVASLSATAGVSAKSAPLVIQ